MTSFTRTRKDSEPLSDDELAGLPIGFNDLGSVTFVPPDLRAGFVDFPAELEAKIVRELWTTGQVIVTPPNRKGPRVLEPASSAEDAAVALVVRKVALLRCQQEADEAAAKRAADDARTYTCRLCGALRLPATSGRGVRPRPLPGADGGVTACGDCHDVLARMAVDRLAAEPVGEDGRTRAEVCAEHLDRRAP